MITLIANCKCKLYGISFSSSTMPIDIEEELYDRIKDKKYFLNGTIKLFKKNDNKSVVEEDSAEKISKILAKNKCSFIKPNGMKCKNKIYKNGLCIVHFKREFPEMYEKIKKDKIKKNKKGK